MQQVFLTGEHWSSSCKSQISRSVQALPDHVRKDASLDEEEVAIGMEIAEAVERGRKDKLPAFRNVPKRKLLEETARLIRF